jgi:hypothetical protein
MKRITFEVAETHKMHSRGKKNGNKHLVRKAECKRLLRTPWKTQNHNVTDKP